ncbi:MAG: hypothetical protein KKA05_11445, partial [Alphaproteobacteria bacterium]|nr:hypothetical protein [Alphaproteobacteria bacterium]
QIVNNSGVVIGGLVSTDELPESESSYINKIRVMLAGEDAPPLLDLTADVRIKQVGVETPIDVYKLIKADSIVSAISFTLPEVPFQDLQFMTSDGLVSNNSIYVEGLSTPFLFLSSSSAQAIVLQYKINDQATNFVTSWNEIDLSGSQSTQTFPSYKVHFSGAYKGDSGTNYMYGSQGDDTINGGDGADILMGFAGADNFIYDDALIERTSLDGDKIDGGEDDDTLDYKLINFGSTYNVAGVYVSLLTNSARRADLTGNTDSIYNIEHIIGSNYNDTLVGNNGNNELTGGRGKDTLLGLQGSDTLFAYVPNEGFEGDSYDGGDGYDTLIYKESDFSEGLYFRIVDTLIAVAATDVFVTGAYDNITNIEAIGATTHADHFSFWGDLSKLNVDFDAESEPSGQMDIADFSGYTKSLQINAGEDGSSHQTVSDTGIVLINFEHFKGGSENDIIHGNAVKNEIFGNAGVDHLYGGDGNDILYGGLGDDHLDGGTDDFDTASYLDIENPLLFTIDGADISISGPDAGNDTLIEIENIQGTNYADTFTFSGDLSKTKLSFDGGGQSYGTRDVADFSQIDGGATINQDGMINGTTITLKNIENFIGGVGKDVIHAVGKLDAPDAQYDGFIYVETGAGDDFVTPTGRGIIVDLGTGKDTLINPGLSTIIHAGLDDGDRDDIEIGDNVYISELGFEDRLNIGGHILTGAGKSVHSESVWAYKGGIRYTMNEVGDLLISVGIKSQLETAADGLWTTYVADYQSILSGGGGNTAGILLYEYDSSVIKFFEKNNLPKEYSIFNTQLLEAHLKSSLGDQYQSNNLDPIALDLDGDGLEIRPENILSPYFDMNGDGFAERAGWIGKDDGWLVQDHNANGKIDDIYEMLGEPGVSGYAELAALDDNNDGVVDANDTAFSSLKIWRDANGNGITDTGELKTLAEWNITSINANATDTTPQQGNKYAIFATGEYTKSDGSTGLAGELLFANSMHNTKWLENITITAEAAALPQLKGHG